MSDAPSLPAPFTHLGAGPPAGADPRPGGEGLPSLAEARARRPRPSWFRLGPESWAMIVAEYEAGATAKQLALKWGVSPGSIYRHVGEAGRTKQSRGEAIDLEAVARFEDRGAEAQARAVAEAQSEVCERDAREAEADPAEAADTLVRRAAARSLAGRVDEALSLLKTAEALRKAIVAAPGEEALDEAMDDDGAGDWTAYTEAQLEQGLANLTRNLGLGGSAAQEDAWPATAAQGDGDQPSARP